MLTCKYRFLFGETRTHSPAEFLMVDCKTILETRKWASFYIKKEKVDRLKKALKEGKCPVMDMEFWKMFSISVGDRMGTPGLPWDKDWYSSHEDVLMTIHYNDKLVLNTEHAIQITEGYSVTSPINTNQLSLEGSSHWAVNTRDNSKRMRTAAENHDWEHLNNVNQNT